MLAPNKNDVELPINWNEISDADFSFAKNWDYPEGVYRNEFGQLSCDGFCPSEIERMKDLNGKIIADSLSAFYKLVDTTHLYTTIKSEANVYEWAGVNYINFQKLPDNSILGQTQLSIATHSSLTIIIKDHSVTAWITYYSIAHTNEYRFPLKEGDITIDRELFKRGIIKAKFDFKFVDTIDSESEIYWKGLVYSSLN